MRSVLTWSAVSAAILLAALFIKCLPDQVEGAALTGILFLVTGGLLLKVCKGSR